MQRMTCSTLRVLPALLSILVATPLAYAQPREAGQTNPGQTMPSIPDGKDTDLKFYSPDGAIATGRQALEQMPHANLVLWVAGNQFFAMDDVIHGFQKDNATISVGLITLPPGLLLQAIKAGGWVYNGKDYRGRPDIYASVNLGHLRDLKRSGMMDDFFVYMHNELQIMVGKGNPKKITGIDDLVRDDVRTSLPNPVNEGIMQFYLRRVLERHGLWQTISAGRDCVACQTTTNNWFTAVHHRETPERIATGRSDAGVVWRTEGLQALRTNTAVDTIALPAEDSLRNEVSYVIGVLTETPHAAAAKAYMNFLRATAGQDIYVRYGFVPATDEDLKLKPID